MKAIAHIHTGFRTKFGIPRQSGLVSGLTGRIVFEPEFRNADALRGLEDFSHIWLIWDFSLAHRTGRWSPTVRPPRLGGNTRMGVWATRSPFRPNSLGLSSVRVTGIRTDTEDGPVIDVEGADMMDGTPILDIKPYLPFTDSHPDARGGFAEDCLLRTAAPTVDIPDGAARLLGPLTEAVKGLIAQDPRPHYHDDPRRIYAMEYGSMEIKFRIGEGRAEVVSATAIAAEGGAD